MKELELLALGLGIELGQLLGMLRGDVGALGEVVLDVVELPHVVLRLVDVRPEALEGGLAQVPRELVQLGARPPAILVDGPAGEVLEVLDGVALLAVGIFCQHDTAAVAGRQVGLLLRVLHRFRLGEAMLEDGPDSLQLAAQGFQHQAPSSSRAMTPVSSRLSRVRGSITFQPSAISWS